jgi:renalase
MTRSDSPITIVGAGISGAACATVLRDAGVPFQLVDRGRAPGGRMASPELHGRRVDIGAGYFTVRDSEFTALAARWESAGLARTWTDTFGVLSPNSEPETSTGPTRWRTSGGLRSLVRSMLSDVTVENVTVDALPDGDVVLAMPDPQAARLTTVPEPVDYQPVLAVVVGFGELRLPFRDAAFVNGHPVIEFLADDGARRGDGAPVLVAHTTADFARGHLDDPDAAAVPVVEALGELLGTEWPSWTHVHRWSFGKPVSSHDASFALLESEGRRIGFAGDQWCASGTPRVESAWRSGTDLGRALVR